MDIRSSNQTFTAGAPVLLHRRVKIDDGKVIHCGADDKCIGFAQGNYLADRLASVRLANDTGSFPMEAAGAIPQWATVYGAADGKIAAEGDLKLGIAKGAAAADGDVIEVIFTGQELDDEEPEAPQG